MCGDGSTTRCALQMDPTRAAAPSESRASSTTSSPHFPISHAAIQPVAASATEEPDYDMLDAQGRKEDRDALKHGETASIIAGARRKRRRPSQSEREVTKDELGEGDSESDEYEVQ